MQSYICIYFPNISPKIISAIHFILFCNFKLNISKIKSIKMIKELFLKNFSKIT